MSRRPRPYSSVAAIAGGRPSSRPPAELTHPIATTHDGRDITRPWIHELEEFRDQRLQGALDWGVYDRILLDDQVQSCLVQRRTAVVSREWSVASGAPGDTRADAAAEALEANLKEVGWDLVTDKMLYAPFYGVTYAELGWGLWRWKGETLFGWVGSPTMNAIHVRHGRRFRRDKDRRLRLITTSNMTGEIMPDRKFWVVTAGGSDDDEPYGRGLAEWLYWPTLFKRNGIRFWNIFLDKFSVPPVKGSYQRGTSREEIEKLLQSMMALANDSGIAVPEGVVLDFMQIATNGIDFEKMPLYMDAAIAKIILSQTMTTTASASGLGSNQANVQAGVKQELVAADADLLTDSFTKGPARWFTDFNFGTDVAAPIVSRVIEEESDLKSTAETDEVLGRMGYERTEDSFQSVYGDGFQRRKPAEAAPPAKTASRAPTAPPRAANDDPGADGDEGRQAAAFAEPAAAGDVVDQAVAAIMADEGWRTAMAPIADPILRELAAARNPDDVAAILARAAELDDEGPLAEQLARAGFAVRMAAVTGAGD
jgi:phage gp29-like protein